MSLRKLTNRTDSIFHSLAAVDFSLSLLSSSTRAFDEYGAVGCARLNCSYFNCLRFGLAANMIRFNLAKTAKKKKVERESILQWCVWVGHATSCFLFWLLVLGAWASGFGLRAGAGSGSGPGSGMFLPVALPVFFRAALSALSNL